MPNLSTGAAVIAVFAAFFWAQGDEAREPLAKAQAKQELRRDLAAAQVCEGQPFTWDGGTLICHKERQ